MNTVKPELTTSFYEPSKKAPCVCGSGLKFKRCCYGRYSSKSLKEFRKNFNSGNYKQALIHVRSHFTWYALVHKAHTINLLKKDEKFGHELLQIDINALAELLENIGLCYHQLKIGKDFIKVIENSQSLIDDIKWIEKISYAKGLWHLVEHNDEKSAYISIKNINIHKCIDPDVLTLYLQVNRIGTTFNESSEIIERIIANTKKESVKLQYRVLRGVNYFLIFQKEDAIKEINNAIKIFESLPAEKKSTYGNFQYANALELIGNISNNNDFYEKGKELILMLIAEADSAKFKDEYVKDLYKLLGDIEEHLGHHMAAIEAYKRCTSDLAKVFHANSLCNNDDIVKARSMLKSVDDRNLDNNGKFDLALSWAMIALNTLENTDIDKAKNSLKLVRTDEPYFKQLRDEQLIKLLETTPKEDKSKIQRILSRLNKYIILNPNIFGIGLNLNKIIEDADSQMSKKG